jgi:tRNA threonylcarbamoyladenosine biosynthesis protein TsaE
LPVCVVQPRQSEYNTVEKETAMAFTLHTILTHSAEQTQRIGERLGNRARAGDLFFLEGELGAGKTCFAQGLGRGLGIVEEINSPTFILANEHRGGRLTLYHLDVYRVHSADEAIGIGLDDYLSSDGVCVIEWAEKIRTALPAEGLWIAFRHVDENSRELKFTATGKRYVDLLNELKNATRD